ncbi:5691_t:CDS:1, partial [Cetraspora pellucida]
LSRENFTFYDVPSSTSEHLAKKQKLVVQVLMKFGYINGDGTMKQPVIIVNIAENVEFQ